jgi:hypothetical protein
MMAFNSADGVKTRKVLLTLDEETIDIFREAGGGNVSLGARLIAKGEDIPSPRTTEKPAKKSVADIVNTKKKEGVRRGIATLSRRN